MKEIVGMSIKEAECLSIMWQIEKKAKILFFNPTLDTLFGVLEECPSGRRSTLGKRVNATSVSWVRIPPPPIFAI